MRNTILIIIILVMLSGCDVIDDMKGIREKQEIAQGYISENYGWSSQIGFSINNGVLTQATLVLDANEVGNKKIVELEEIARETVSITFKSMPKAINIQISNIEVESRNKRLNIDAAKGRGSR